ncbi:ADP-ribosylglycohydrolase family protein [Microbacterium nymphoidis]|uniref:ADP-ribosylglycohydrolase family protein n=1 Tax=Microbacterium nymphoidis TaxID=2898586 RepID=UPI001E4C16A9|nr:ADP-ribosylglycohydrolase family protein [Microbacterium nymphoidis]MCD2498180.1 ADP-ribosylglycohydrolase family protein [Microbacterium nymphoidis]
MTESITMERAVRAAHGLALGDALGLPASEHRTVRDPWVRSMLRQGASDLDRARVLRPVAPFVLSATGAAPMTPTDDAETFAVIARVLLAVGADADADAMFDAWLPQVSGDDVWMSAAQRSAVLNAAAGLRPPQTGADNPAFYDDSALPGAVAVGIAVTDPARAAQTARALASVTHDGGGVVAAGAVAALVAALVGGAALTHAIALAVGEMEADDWLADGARDAFAILGEAPTPFAAIPELIARFAPRTYSHPGTVAETLPLALALVSATEGDHERALPLAMTVARHQDSLPALVGAMCGAAGSAIDGALIDELSGVTVPAVAGVSLAAVARELSSLR